MSAPREPTGAPDLSGAPAGAGGINLEVGSVPLRSTAPFQPQEPKLPAAESHADRLTRLRTTGFRKLRDGRIHVRCYTCGRKVSNTTRMDYDPPTAVLIETPCEKCSQGCKEPESFYYDATGTEVEEPNPYCADCGCYLGGGMTPRSARDTRLCVECADDDTTDSLAGAPVPAVDKGAEPQAERLPSRSTTHAPAGAPAKASSANPCTSGTPAQRALQ
jgi:hypothetical protein